MQSRKSRAELIRLLELAIREVGNLDSTRFYVVVRDVEVVGSPPERLVAWAMVRFLPAGAPFCCGEPACYSRAFREEGRVELGEFVARRMNIEHEIDVELKTAAEYFPDIEFEMHKDGSR